MKEVIADPNSPPSTSPVSQATRGGGFVFVGGQMPRDLATGEIVEGATAQSELSLRHCLAVLAAAGCGPENVLFATVYVTDLAAKPAVNDAFREAFPNDPPARNLVAVKEIGEDAIVEISLLALA